MWLLIHARIKVNKWNGPFVTKCILSYHQQRYKARRLFLLVLSLFKLPNHANLTWTQRQQYDILEQILHEITFRLISGVYTQMILIYITSQVLFKYLWTLLFACHIDIIMFHYTQPFRLFCPPKLKIDFVTMFSEVINNRWLLQKPY